MTLSIGCSALAPGAPQAPPPLFLILAFSGSLLNYFFSSLSLLHCYFYTFKLYFYRCVTSLADMCPAVDPLELARTICVIHRAAPGFCHRDHICSPPKTKSKTLLPTLNRVAYTLIQRYTSREENRIYIFIPDCSFSNKESG